jgi:hypothetical protein
MSTVTTNFPTASVRRAHAARFADSVVAGYIRSLTAEPRANERPRVVAASSVGDTAGYATAPAEIVSAAIEANQALASHDEGRPRKSDCWHRGGRIAHAMRAQRVLEAR